MNNSLTAEAETGEAKVAVAPLVVEGYIVVVFACLMDGLWDAGGEFGCIKEAACGVEEGHGAVDAYPDVDAVLLGYANDVLHVLKAIPRRETEHQ